MRGYTPETEHVRRFEPAFVRELVRGLNVPVVAEGRVSTPGEAAAALAAGAFAVIVGTAITRPQDITRDFALAVERERKREEQPQFLLGIDLGGTNTKFGVVAGDGRLVASSVAPTPPGGGREILLNHLKQIAAQCQNLAREAGVSATGMGVATAGWVDAETGRVAYATENLPGWTGTPIAAELRGVVDLPVAVENDANALAVAERHFGLARDVNDFVCITLGTGVGGGCYVDGRLNRGSHFFANALGHITIEMNGLPCTCGRKGCLEPYANAAALVRYAEGAFLTAEEVIHAANAGDNLALQAVRRYAGYLAVGAASIIHLLDPSMLILSGGIAQQNPNLLHDLEEELSSRVTAWEQRRLQVRFSELGYFGGVLGAAGLAMQRSLSPSS